MFNAGTRETESQKRTLCHHPSTHHQSSTSGTEGDFEICKEISGHSYKTVNDGQGQQPRPTGTILLPNGRQNIHFSPD